MTYKIDSMVTISGSEYVALKSEVERLRTALGERCPIRAEQIPDEVRRATTKAILKGLASDEAIAAALNAWPGAETFKPYNAHLYKDTIILPLPQKEGDA